MSQAAKSEDIGDKLGLAKTKPAKTREASLRWTWYLIVTCRIIEVHPETYEVRADGELLNCEPATELPMAQRYFLFELIKLRL